MTGTYDTAGTYSFPCYSPGMTDRGELLARVMAETRTSQSELARLSGVRQPSISQFCSGKAGLSDELLDRLLSCMGRRLQVERRSVTPELTRSERRSWLLHCRLARTLDAEAVEAWRPLTSTNLRRLREGVRGQPHRSNVERWAAMLESGDLTGLRRALTGLNRDSIELREVSPLSGVLSEQEREQALAAC